jgi:hypothetical protein
LIRYNFPPEKEEIEISLKMPIAKAQLVTPCPNFPFDVLELAATRFIPNCDPDAFARRAEAKYLFVI